MTTGFVHPGLPPSCCRHGEGRESAGRGADRVPGLGPGLAEPRPTQPAASRADEDQAVFTWLGESLQVPAELMRDLSGTRPGVPWLATWDRRQSAGRRRPRPSRRCLRRRWPVVGAELRLSEARPPHARPHPGVLIKIRHSHVGRMHCAPASLPIVQLAVTASWAPYRTSVPDT